MFSGPIHKKSSMSEASSSEVMEMDESALVADPHLETNLRRLQEEERLLLEQQAILEAGNVDDIAALEHQDTLRLNQLQQQELQRLQHQQNQRIARYQQLLATEHAALRRDQVPAPRRRAACVVRLNTLHAAEAIETDV